MRRLLALPCLLAASPAAYACVVCDSKTAHQVRHEIFDRLFLHHLTLIAAPFPVFLLIAAALYFTCPLPAGVAPPRQT